MTFKLLLLFAMLLQTIFGFTIIDSGQKAINMPIHSNQKDDFKNIGNGISEVCTISPELIAEIKSYQPIVDQIVAAVVKGPHSGSTWNRFVYFPFKLLCLMRS